MPWPGSCGRLRGTEQAERTIDGTKRFPEQLEWSRVLLGNRCFFESLEQPVENTRALDNGICEDLVHGDAPIGEYRNHVRWVRIDERSPQLLRFVLQSGPPCSDIGTILSSIAGTHTLPEDPMRKYFLVAALLALVLSACRVETNVILSIEEDGSGAVGFEIGMDQEFRDLMEQSGGSLDDLVGEMPDFGEGDVTMTNRTDGDMEYVGVLTTIDDISEFDFSGDGGDFFSAFSYEYDDKSASLAATLSAGDMAGDTGDLPFDVSSLTGDLFSANVVVSMPGTVIEHNADKVLGDGTLVWEIPLSGTTDIFAKSTFGGSSNSWIVWVLLGFLIVGIIAAVTATIISRKESKKAVAAAAAASTPVDTTPPPPVADTVDGSEETGVPSGATDDAAAPDDADDQPETT